MKLIMRGHWRCSSGDFYGELALEVPSDAHVPDRLPPTSAYHHLDEKGDCVETRMIWLAQAIKFYLGKDEGFFRITVEELVTPISEIGQRIQVEIKCE